jgi:hypothetical protein
MIEKIEEYDNPIIICRNGYSPGSKLFWELKSEKKYTKLEIQDLQTKKGYPIFPYDFVDFVEESVGNINIYTWACYASAD